MIDFRYHLVSIVAIFLALALGIVLGSTTLSDSVSETLRQQANSAAKTAQQARTQQRQLEHRMNGQEQFAQVLAPQIVLNRLRGQSLVLVETPGAGEDGIERIGELAKDAGASVTGRVTVQKKFLDDDQRTTVDELATQLKPDGVEYPEGATAYDKAGAVLAAALVTKDPARSGREDAAGGAVLNAFTQAGYITASGKPGQHATLAVVVAPASAYAYDGGGDDNKALISLASALDAAGRGTVVGGPPTSAQEGGLIAALRDSDTKDSVSAIDVVDSASGQVVTILALQNEMSGKSGQYGTGAGTSGYAPSPAPEAGKNG
ncbi:copper transport outer membrane protein MctB [Actinomadura pelletieri DSM 43383]|uniref:Copper transport outer membrane protein MctB n=1 Tax=Actinomadura pelletieri DSM 43383 TaxID=1120940 RepID=A0A495QL11_9ACTN|nr:copper transporter [Actinomadura pelletieri]RKS73244.1 copper transport outer membrane protein MctB [Actinomadura pelletieri DSM 43383]